MKHTNTYWVVCVVVVGLGILSSCATTSSQALVGTPNVARPYTFTLKPTEADIKKYAEPAPAKVMKWSAWERQPGGVQAFFKRAMAENAVALLDKNIILNEPIRVDGDLYVRGTADTYITVTGLYAFILLNGKHCFDNLFFRGVSQNPDAAIVYTEPQTGLVYKNYFTNIRSHGPALFYVSSRGGVPGNDATAVFRNVELYNKAIAISIYSQDGPYKTLQVTRAKIGTDNSHCMYVHPNVSIDLYDFVPFLSGKLVLNHFSSNGVPGVARYVKMVKVMGGKDASYTVADSVKNVFIDSSDLNIYNTYPQNMHVQNTKLGSNGIARNSVFINCTGTAYIGFGNTYKNCNFSYIGTANAPGVQKASFIDCNLGMLGMSGLFDVSIKNTQIGDLGTSAEDKNSRIIIDKKSGWKTGYGWKPKPGLMRVVDKL